MPFQKGDVVSLQFEMPDTGAFKEHPAIIISCPEVHQHDSCYVCVMMTSNGASDRFTFRLTDEMLAYPNNRQDSQVRCHMITYVRERDIHSQSGRPFNKLQPLHMDRLLEYINMVVFDN